MNNKIETEMGGERVVIKLGVIERIGFMGGLGGLGALAPLGFGHESLWAFCALFALLSIAFFRKSSINMCMPERLMFLGFLGSLGFLAFIPGMGFMSPFSGFSGFFGYSGFLGLPKKHFYPCPEETTK
jgi:hypothetical protein